MATCLDASLPVHSTSGGKVIIGDNGGDKLNESKLPEAIMKAPAGTDECTNRQLEAAQYLLKKLRSKTLS